jgi:hypothetical protein
MNKYIALFMIFTHISFVNAGGFESGFATGYMTSNMVRHWKPSTPSHSKNFVSNELKKTCHDTEINKIMPYMISTNHKCYLEKVYNINCYDDTGDIESAILGIITIIILFLAFCNCLNTCCNGTEEEVQEMLGFIAGCLVESMINGTDDD